MERAPRRTPTEWQGILADQKQSGLSFKKYSKENQIKYQTLLYWRKKLSVTNGSTSKGFVSLHKPVRYTSSRIDNIKLQYENNIELELPTNYEVSNLVSLLKGLSC